MHHSKFPIKCGSVRSYIGKIICCAKMNVRWRYLERHAGWATRVDSAFEGSSIGTDSGEESNDGILHVDV
jgi:hypothetical protein